MKTWKFAIGLIVILLTGLIWNSRSANKDTSSISTSTEAPKLSEPVSSSDVMGNTIPEEKNSGESSPSEHERIRRQWLRDSIAHYEWNAIAPGVDFARAEGKWKTNIGDSYLYLLRADPELTEFVIHSAKQSGRPQTARQWCESEDLIAAMNAGMYQANHATNLGFMKIGEFVNQSRISNDNLFIAFGPQKTDLPPAQVIDRDCHDWESLIANYEFVTQSIRMMDCRGKNRWSRQEKYWSVAAAGVDDQGRLIMIHSRSPWSMHDFVEMVSELNLDLLGLIYLEGGPEASLYVNGFTEQHSLIGSYETGFYESDDNDRFWPIPNVIGVRMRE